MKANYIYLMVMIFFFIIPNTLFSTSTFKFVLFFLFFGCTNIVNIYKNIHGFLYFVDIWEVQMPLIISSMICLNSWEDLKVISL